MGEPAVPTEDERGFALGLAEAILEAIRNDEPVIPPSTHELWLLAATLKHHVETIAAFREASRG